MTEDAAREAHAVGQWLGATSAPVDVIAAQERVATALDDRERLWAALKDARALAKAIVYFTENEVPEEWDGGSVGYELGGICSMAIDLLAALGEADND